MDVTEAAECQVSTESQIGMAKKKVCKLQTKLQKVHSSYSLHNTKHKQSKLEILVCKRIILLTQDLSTLEKLS